MIFRHKKLVAMLALAVQGISGVAAKVGAAKVGAAEALDEAAETVVSSGVDRYEADSDSVPLPETGDESGLASRTVPRAAKLVIPFVGGAALLAGLAAFVGYRLFQSIVPKGFTQVFTDIRTVREVLGSRLSLLLDIFRCPYRHLQNFFKLETREEIGMRAKIGVVGDACSGKDLIFLNKDGNYVVSDYVPSVGVDFFVCKNGNSRLTFWVFAGNDLDQLTIGIYLRDVDAIFVVISVEDRSPAETAEKWVKLCGLYIDSDVPFVFILNKTDLESDYSVDHGFIKKIKNLMGSTPWFIYTASAKNNTSDFVAWTRTEEPAPA
jgi:signal recognition particle receptor subunit beta